MLIISFSLVSGTGQQMLDVAGETHTVIPMQFSAFLCLKIDFFGEKNLDFCRFADACSGVSEEMADHNSHAESRQSKPTNELCDPVPRVDVHLPTSAACARGCSTAAS